MSQAQSPSKKYRVCVIGSTGRGNYGHGIDTMWADLPDTEVVAVADDNKVGLAKEAAMLKVDKTFSDYREMLDKMKPDIVAIGPRWLDQHRDMVVAAADRGIHIYMEKPLCRTLAEADDMATACEKTHVKLAIAHQTHYSPKLPVVKEFLDKGGIGRILEMRGRGKEDGRGGGEDLWVLGSHIMDLMRYFGGQPEWCYASVLANGKPVTKADVRQGPEGIGALAGDNVRAMYGLPNGVSGYFASQRSAFSKASRFGLVIYGSAGVLEILTGHLGHVRVTTDGSWTGRINAPWENFSTNGPGKPETVKDGGLHAGNLLGGRDLIESIEQKRAPKCGINEARAAIEMIVAVFDSHRQSAPVTLPLKNRQNPLEML